MKNKYTAVLLCAVFALAASSAFAQKGKCPLCAKGAMAKGFIAEDCAAFFPKALGGHIGSFDDRAEAYMENNSFWETCIQPYLDKGQNVTVNFLTYTETEGPTARDVAQAVRAAKDFKEEFDDYVEDVQEYTGVYEKPEAFTYLQVPSSVNTNKQLMKEVKKANKHYKAKSDMPKVIVSVKFMQAPKPEAAGLVRVTGPSSKAKALPAMPEKPMDKDMARKDTARKDMPRK